MKNLIFNTQVCTTIEQSKRLLRLGINPNTADCTYWKPNEFEDYMLFPNGLENKEEDEVSAWSLHRLIAMLPDEIEWLSVMLSRTCYFHPVFYKDKIAYTDMEGWRHIFNDQGNIYDNIIDCIEWLIKENKFNKKYLKEDKS